MHFNCRSRGIDDPKSILQQSRAIVEDDKVNWDVIWESYKPYEFTTEKILKNPVWADPADPNEIKNWNLIDNGINRTSYTGKYELIDGRPRNPVGRTGITGRGRLGRWGPNHAADAIVTRWKTNFCGDVYKDPDTKKPLLQFISILRKDTNTWAIPGGMLELNEEPLESAKRELMEEAFEDYKFDPSFMKLDNNPLSKMLNKGVEIFSGYVDDPRNTDNSWMETFVVNFHDEEDLFTKELMDLDIKAGDDASNVEWKDIHSDLKIYADHLKYLKIVAEKHNAHF